LPFAAAKLHCPCSDGGLPFGLGVLYLEDNTSLTPGGHPWR
jgi:hypothetical protein